ncbi:MAG: YkgJ family cysteine cluster protein, partial [Gemmatimonadota bacterium]|nr:YkgJ family cysteine cluster protein [Gemmatimonadota bacterium]
MSKRKKQHQKKKGRFLFQERKSYNCQACGTCCRQWTIYLDQAEVKRLTAINWVALARRLENVAVVEEVIPPGEANPRPALARKQDGSCVFLEEDGLCLVHRHRGFHVKPLPCRMFPFRLIDTP